jgi:hypothetical protein
MKARGILYAVSGALLFLLGGRLFRSPRLDGLLNRPDFLLEDEEILEGFNRLAPDNIGYLLVRKPDGTIVLLVVEDQNREIPTSAPQVPEVVGRSEPFEGIVKDLELLIVPSGQLPEGFNDPIPQPGPSGELSPELLAERRRRLDEQRRQRFRYVVVTEEQTDSGPVCVIRVFDGDGRLISSTRKEGAFVKAVANDATGEKAVLTRQAAGQSVLLIDVVTGESKVSSDSILGRNDDIQDLNAVSGFIIVFEQLMMPPRVIVRIFGPEGAPPRHVIEIPGMLVKGASIHDAGTIKSVVTELDGQVYNDLIEVLTGRRLTPLDAQGLAQNPIRGTFADNQFHQPEGQSRFVISVYNADRDETEVRILDGAGRIVRTVLLPGKFARAEVRDGRKEFISRPKDGPAQVTVIDLLTGLTIR